MTQEQTNQFLEKVEAYFNQQLKQIKAQGNLELDNLLVEYHSKNIRNTKVNIVEDNNERLRHISECKENYADFFEEIAKPNIKSINSQFNIMLSAKENSANTFYQKCVNRGLSVQKIDLSSFKVSEYDGI